MSTLDKINNKAILKESVKYLESQGYKNIRAEIDGYQTPTKYHRVGSDVHIGPDIEADLGGHKHYFEIGVRPEKPQQLKSKWEFLERVSKSRHYQFKVITRRGHYKFTQDMLDALHIDRNPIKL